MPFTNHPMFIGQHFLFNVHYEISEHLCEIKSTDSDHILCFFMIFLKQKHMFHSEILASLNFNKNKISSHGLEKNHTLKCCRAIFQHNNICQDCWKNIRSTFECMVILKSRGQGQKKDGELRYKTVPYFQLESGHCLLDWRITIHSNVDLVFFQQS